MRRAVVALVLLAGLAACSSDPSVVDSSPTTTTAVAGATSTTGPATTTTGRGATSTTAARAGTAPTSAPPAARALGAPGADAPLYLRPAPARALRIQVLAQADAAPQQSTLDALRAVLHDVSGKPVTVVETSLAAGTSAWTDASIARAAAGRAPQVAADTALLQVLYVSGSYGGDESVLGITVNAGVAAVFSHAVAAASNGLASPSRIERAVSTHELGHLLGLVDLYLHTGRADPQHPGHSTNPRSVMYWAVESDVIGDLLSGGPPTDFDSADRSDLASIRGG